MRDDGDDDADDNGDGEKVFINNSEKSNYFVQLGAGGKRGQPGQPHPEHRMRGWFFFPFFRLIWLGVLCGGFVEIS